MNTCRDRGGSGPMKADLEWGREGEAVRSQVGDEGSDSLRGSMRRSPAPPVIDNNNSPGCSPFSVRRHARREPWEALYALSALRPAR
ncbi:hypothetical protein BaRGS_00002539 [Batillaria attramentaria]|uniref:Uncharacterized protein n=1 Tax=Batillaria attramentaria TaxID=370345 RepID=A0ABD0M579_9CAEN